MYRDGARKSIWQEEIKRISSEADFNQLFDVVIVGGGITGVSTALRLQENGKNCILLEASNIGFGTTGGTTAHINDFFDTTFDQAINNFGIDRAKLFAEVGKEALEHIKNNIRKYHLDCDFEEKSAVLFALDDKQAEKLKDIAAGASKVGHEMTYTEEISFPIPFKEAVVIPNQAQFHPVKYIKGLCDAFLQLGGSIQEDCIVESHDEQEEVILIKTSKGKLKAKNLIYATHIPPGVNLLHFMTAPYRSYVIAFNLKNDEYPKELGYDLTEPYHYYRTQKIEGETLLIAGGEDHKTGHEENTGECFSRLENYIRQYFDVETVYYSWSSQYYESVDGFPYIGKLPGTKEKIYTATGFRGNGMVFGTITSQILTDIIVHGKSKYEEIFSPSRVKPIAGFTEFVKEAATVAYDFIKDKITAEKIVSWAEVKNGEAKVVKYHGQSFAIYKEKEGKTHVLKSTCPHAHCEVRWNNAELSWDCPCHGSRFNVNGKMLTGPSAKDLQRIEPEENSIP